jgi:hypothetical protein
VERIRLKQRTKQTGRTRVVAVWGSKRVMRRLLLRESYRLTNKPIVKTECED